MSSEKEISFTSQFEHKLRSYLEHNRVDGRNLYVDHPSYYGKYPDIVLVDDKKVPQLIIETKRKTETTHEELYDPLGKAPIAQALCYAALAQEYHQLEKTPLFATANRDEIIIFKGINREELKALVDINACRERHESPEDWSRCLKAGAYEIIRNYILARLENPLSEDTIKKLFDYVGKWLIHAPITPQQLYRILVEELRRQIEVLSNEYVEEAVKNKILEDEKYFEELDRLAQQQGFTQGILSRGLFSLKYCGEKSVREKICVPLAKVISDRLSKAQNSHEKFLVLKEIKDKKVKDLVENCKDSDVCNQKVRNLISFKNLSRLMTYVLASKILGYKILELHFDITPIQALKVSDPNQAVKILEKMFEETSKKLEEVTHVKDFKPLFNTGLYDKIVFKGAEAVNKLNALIETLDVVKNALRDLPGIVGYIYEGFIPPLERHQLGQFYTPPAIARLITRWCIRSGDDKVLDGGCGSGTFLIEAYKRLLFLKYNKIYGESFPSCSENYNEHQDILSNLYGVDLNGFAAQLSMLHLMLMEPRCPFSKLNIETKDYFSLTREGYSVSFDAVIGNPPYTRWVEIPEETKSLIEKYIGEDLKDYNLKADLRRGREPGIYVYWVIHASENLLRKGGRLGMIISNMWLQTDYGIEFGRFLLDHFKVRALIDISYRLFDALISTVIVLAEEETSKDARDNNEVLLIRIPPIDRSLSDKEVERRLDETLKCIERSITPNYEFDKTVIEECKRQHGIWYKFIRQSHIPTDKKWISLFFEGVEDIGNILEKHPLIIRADKWFKPSRGNSIWSIWALDNGRRPDLGAKDFFYFSESKIEEWERKVKGFGNAVRQYLVPAITASRYVKTFEFTHKDWERIRGKGVRGEKRKEEGKAYAYILVAHEGKENLPQQLQEYIRWGETECKTRIRGTRGGGRICSEAEACKAREKAGKPFFYGWYDLGGYIPTPIMAIRQAGYHPQFFLATAPFITYDAIITFIPKVRIKMDRYIYDPTEYNKKYGNIMDVNLSLELDEAEIKALSAYLNSTFVWIWLEHTGRRTGGGILALECDISEEIPMLNVKEINREDVEELARLFDELESKARQFTGTSSDAAPDEEGEGGGKLEMFRELRPIFRKIDSKIAEILGITVDVDALWDSAWEMMERRVKGAGRRVRPGAEVEIDIEERERKRRSSPPDNVVPLTKWLEPQGDERGGIETETSNDKGSQA
jgi:type I restriction-modification system DNA methylase subunit